MSASRLRYEVRAEAAVLDLDPAPHGSALAGDATDAHASPPARSLRVAKQIAAVPGSSARSTFPPEIASSLCHGAADERLLAWIRFGAAAVLFALLISGSGSFHSPLVKALAAGYVGYSALVLLVSAVRPEWLIRQGEVIHGIDFCWTTVASSVGGGTAGHVFPLFILVLAAAAFRWGLPRTLLDGVLVLLVATAQNVAATMGLTPWQFELDLFLLSATYMGLGTAVLFGTLADRLHRARREAVVAAGLVSSLSRAPGLANGIADTLTTFTRVLGASRLVLIAEEAHTGVLAVWRTRTEPGDRITTTRVSLPRGVGNEWKLTRSATLMPSELRVDRKGACRVAATLAADAASAEPWLDLPRGVAMGDPWKVMLAAPFTVSGVWSGQLYVIDPNGGPRGELRLRFLTDLMRQVTPGLLNLYLVRRLRTRAESLERGRISRELHDGVLQSLAGVEMRLEVLRRQTAPATPLLAELTEIQAAVHRESMDVRQLTLRLHSTDVDARRLPAALADLVQRFSRAAEIDGRLEWAAAQLPLTPHQCSEVMRIVQEALFNVRRHSGASTALVRVEADADAWALIVEDNGRGLGFTGRVAGMDLEVQRKGPRVIRERVVALGGHVAVDSSDRGTRLEITFPGLEQD